MKSSSILLSVVLSVAALPLCQAQDTHPLVGKWVGSNALANKHYEALGKTPDPRLAETLESLTIEFKPDDTYVFSQTKYKIDIKQSFVFLPNPEGQKGEFMVEVTRGGPPPQVWNCKIAKVEDQDALLISIKDRPDEVIVLVRSNVVQLNAK